jgi:uncharacterized protein YciI
MMATSKPSAGGMSMRHRFTLALAQLGLMIGAAVAGVVTAQADAPAAVAEPAPAAVKPQQFLYVLRLVPRLHDDGAWTDADNAAVSRHFGHLKQATAGGRVILAGRTTEPGDKTIGLVIFEAAGEDDARRFMESDPAVVAGIMTATLHPYAIALQRKD